jgi:hypothetical protein
VFESQLYAATENEVQGAALWRTADGTNWTPVGGNGFGDLRNIHLGGLGTFAGQLYAGTRNDSTGGQVWRSGNGSSWLPVVFDGFGNPNNAKIEGLYPLGDRLYAVTNNPVNGLEVWRSPDGLSWSQVSLDGLGDSNNDATLWNNATAAYGDSLFLGTWNEANGGEVWRYLPNQVYLPAVRG